MRVLRSLLLLSLLAIPAAFAHSQVAVGIGIGPEVAPYADYGYAYGPPVCSWGYYPYYPYACAPYGYYGPSWFAGGIFIGAGPWYHGYWGRGPWGGWGHGYYGRAGWYGGRGYNGGGYGYGRGSYGGARPAYGGYRGTFNDTQSRTFGGYGRSPVNSFRGGSIGGAHPSYGGGARPSFGGGGFHGGGGFGGGFHGGGGGFHGGGGGFHGGGGHR